jgi:RNA polymerase sigma factor (sigma-70 family)
LTTAEEASARKKAEELLLANLSTVDAIVGLIARRNQLSSDDAEELRSKVRLKLVDDDYAVLRRYRGDSSLQTYLTTVIQNLVLDERVRAWGRYRPSLFARRRGPAAVLLEEFIVRDRRTFDEACALLVSRGMAIDANESREFYECFQSRRRPQVVHEQLRENIVAPDAGQDALLESERIAVADRAAEALRRAIRQLTPRVRLIVQLRFEQGLRIADIARALSEDQKALYREFDRLTIDLRALLEAEGLDGNELTELLGDPHVDFGDALRATGVETSNVVRLKSAKRAEQQGEQL